MSSPPGQSGTHLVVHNDRRRRVRLDRRIGGGGEAEVYQLRGQSKVLAKVYRAPPPADYRTKLEWMMQHPPTLSRRTQHVAIAWPTGLLFDGTMDLVGFLMPRVDVGFPLITAFNPRRRAKALPRFDRRLAFQAAHNLAQIVGDLHAAGYVVGDLNESNVLVTENARISLIDIDSFQVRIPTAGTVVTYRSLVGKPEYTPPELQGVNFRSVDRSYEHDRFALAVLIFQLLMEGHSPIQRPMAGRRRPPDVGTSHSGGHVSIRAHDPSDPGAAGCARHRDARCSNRRFVSPMLCHGTYPPGRSTNRPRVGQRPRCSRAIVGEVPQRASVRQPPRVVPVLPRIPESHSKACPGGPFRGRRAVRQGTAAVWRGGTAGGCLSGGCAGRTTKAVAVPLVSNESSITGSEEDADVALAHPRHRRHPDRDEFIGGGSPTGGSRSRPRHGPAPGWHKCWATRRT